MQLIDPPLTVVVQPIEELARTAATLMVKRVRATEAPNPVAIVLEPTLITRDTGKHLIKTVEEI
jgi:DNA-binding LacI/PurR family transcriptional regulator